MADQTLAPLLGPLHSVPRASETLDLTGELAHRPLFIAGLVCIVGLTVTAIDSPLRGTGLLTVLVLLGLALAAAVAVELRNRPGARLAVGAVVGCVALSVGGGYGVARLIEGSWLAGLIGVLTALAGLWLLIGTGAVALRAASGLRRVAVGLLEIGIAALLLQFGFMPLTYATVGVHPPRIPITHPQPANVTAVEVSTPDGASLGAWYSPTANGAAVILLPGSLGNRGDTAGHATVLSRHGYGVLALDARGSGTSSEFGNMWGWTGTDDIAGAVAWLHGQGVTSDRIGLVGLSMGGEQAITAAPQVDVAAVVAEGVEARMASDIWYVSTDLRGQVERFVSTAMWTLADLLSEGTPPVSLRDAVAAAPSAPILIIAADAPAETAVAADLADESALVEVWQTSEIGHTQALALAPAEWEARVIGFLDRALLGE